ncbi:hypothetical protein [Leisingera methylohalidivorans]|uniref:Uncharacterized protein n=1 Tax=Leisingera methylohalidivorans DSM 14336 TaxID=999552 RepID=V9VZ05_9RHOB|nr:hypothetical protein [Leisingera methylohalidivorans]AHD02999.1 hypothetical protein METH_08240 [Leisingera methylohalidivorans DSM 14336]
MPLIRAAEDSFTGYSCLVEDPDSIEVDSVQWPVQAWCPIDEGTGDEGGWVKGTFRCKWRGDVLYGENEAVNDRYLPG